VVPACLQVSLDSVLCLCSVAPNVVAMQDKSGSLPVQLAADQRDMPVGVMEYLTKASTGK
jgi:hypothetical protein